MERSGRRAATFGAKEEEEEEEGKEGVITTLEGRKWVSEVLEATW